MTLDATTLRALLGDLDPAPVLVDVGASDAPPAVWSAIAPYADYVGFDPDRRELYEIPDSRFRTARIVNEAVTDRTDADNVTFFLTRSPFCSSALKPNTEALANYIFADLFEVERTVTAPAATLAAIADRLALGAVDWLKVDSQGTDLRICRSLGDERLARVLAIDVEPGLIDAYHGEDFFIDAHRELTQRGFWPAACTVKRTVRMRRSTLEQLIKRNGAIDERLVRYTFGGAPGWCEARYFRSLESMRDAGLGRREYVLAFVFALAGEQHGHAVDVAIDYETLFGADASSRLMNDAVDAMLRAGARQFRRQRLGSLPRRVWHRLRG